MSMFGTQCLQTDRQTDVVGGTKVFDKREEDFHRVRVCIRMPDRGVMWWQVAECLFHITENNCK
jgi:hypothetical protein